MPASREELVRRIDQALGREPADLVIRNARLLNVVPDGPVTGDIAICGDTIVGTYESYRGKTEIDADGASVAPGFIDAHVHVESTMVTPAEFDRCVLPRGTTTAICDPHEIANVLGLEGLRYFLDCSERTAMDLFVMLSSCVPATHLETSGASLGARDLVLLRDHPNVLGLAEFMNYPGVLGKDPSVLEKLAAFGDDWIDGHCPSLSGRDLNAYAAAGIRSCHECTTAEEAREKLQKGMQVFIREGSVSKDLDALAGLIGPGTSSFLGFCTDDRNPLDIAEEGHIDHLVRKALDLHLPALMVFEASSLSTARALGLTDRGRVAPGYRADLVILDGLAEGACTVRTVIKDGRVVSDETFATCTPVGDVGRGSVRLDPASPEAFRAPAGNGECSVIGVVPGSIVTEHLRLRPDAEGVLQVVVFERHGRNGNVGRGHVRGFGLTSGALASSVGHDSHNVIVVGADGRDMAAAVNRLVEMGGGFAVAQNGEIRAELPLPLAGLMSDRPFEEVRERLRELRRAVRALGCPLEEPLLQLAFLPLPVIPHLKITDRGMVDVDRFALLSG